MHSDCDPSITPAHLPARDGGDSKHYTCPPCLRISMVDMDDDDVPVVTIDPNLHGMAAVGASPVDASPLGEEPGLQSIENFGIFKLKSG